MGNSQSASQSAAQFIDGVANALAVKTPPGPPPPQQQQQNNYDPHVNQHRPSNHTRGSSLNNDVSYHVVQEEHDDPEYTRFRTLAHAEAQKRNDCFEASQAAYKNREGARAKELSNEGKQHDSLMKRYNEQAADLVFRQKNAHRPPTEIDLHGLYVKEASAKVEEALQRCQQMKLDHLVIIVGKGLHSPGHIAKLKPAIVDLVNRYQVSVEPNKPNPGCLFVEFGKGPSEMSWLDRWLGSNRGDCIIM